MSFQNAKYAFLLPAYKGAFLREALQSILSQTYTNYRVLVSDDCSPEDLKSIVDEFADDPRLTYRRNEANMGCNNLISHWNLLLDLCDTEYCILAPDDDLYDSRFLEEIDNLTEKYSQCDVLKSRAQQIDTDGSVIYKDREYAECITQKDNIFHQTVPDHMSGIGNYVFRTSSLKNMGGFVDYPVAWWSDVMTNILLSKNGMPVTQDILFSMRQSGINISSHQPSRDEYRQKTEASFRYLADMDRLLASFGTLPVYEENRLDYWRKHTGDYVALYLSSAAHAYSLVELFTIMRRYSFIFRFKHQYYAVLRGCLRGRLHK